MFNTSDYTLIRVWTESDLSLNLYDTGGFEPWSGKPRLAYQLCEGLDVIFEGDDFFPSPLHATDSDESVASLLHFLSLRPGDTDSEYFLNYTPEQLAFADSRGEELSMYAHELENPE